MLDTASEHPPSGHQPSTAASGAGSAAAGIGMPRAARLVLWSVLGLLFAGALALIALRGNALILDLSGVVTRVFCL